jgi:hypothetical protein
VAGSSSFFEKKEPKKLFSLWSRRAATCAPQRQHRGGQKVFLLLFVHKKKTLPFLPLALPWDCRFATGLFGRDLVFGGFVIWKPPCRRRLLLMR